MGIVKNSECSPTLRCGTICRWLQLAEQSAGGDPARIRRLTGAAA